MGGCSQRKEKIMVGSKWIYKIKHIVDGSSKKFKAQFMAKGFSKREGVDYDKRFTTVAKYSNIKAMISIAAQMGWKIHQMVIKMAFLDGVIEEEVYIEQSEGFEVHRRDFHVCRLKRALYKLKQAPCAWH